MMLELLQFLGVLAMISGVVIMVSIVIVLALLLCDVFFKTHIGRKFCRWLFSEEV